MIRVHPFAAADLEALDPQPGQPELIGERRARAELLARYQGFTARDVATGRVLFCGGAFANHAGYLTLWAAFAADVPKADMWAISRRARLYVDRLQRARIDAKVRGDFEAGQRWAEFLGLRLEARMVASEPDGVDGLIYARTGNMQ